MYLWLVWRDSVRPFTLHISFPLFKVVQVPENAAEKTEQLGTKYKFWYRDQSYGVALFKEGRPGTGENWAEKIACELANLLNLPHALYELAQFGNRDGVIGISLVSGGARLIHGNELLSAYVDDYDHTEAKLYRRRAHTLRRVVGYLRASADTLGAPYGFKQTDGIRSALDVFVGYLMFDCWIANQDRHDQNWAVLRASDGNSYLSATFDHGSSMGRNESDEKRISMLQTKDMGQHISEYLNRARSALYPTGLNAKHSLTTLEAFSSAAMHAPSAAIEWVNRLRLVTDEQLDIIFNQVPHEWMTDTAKIFTKRLLQLNRDRILGVPINL